MSHGDLLTCQISEEFDRVIRRLIFAKLDLKQCKPRYFQREALIKRLFMEKVLLQNESGLLSVVAQANQHLRSHIPDPEHLDPCANGSRLNMISQAVFDLYGSQRVFDLLRKENSKPRKYRIEPDKVALQFATALNNEAAVRAIMSKVADVWAMRGYLRTTAVHVAAERASTEILDLLLNHSCPKRKGIAKGSMRSPLSLKDQRHLTPLFAALRSSNEKNLQALLEREDANPNSRNDGGDTLLIVAVKYGLENIISILLAKPNIDANATTLLGNTPLCLAANSGRLPIVQLLLAREDVIPDSKNYRKQTPLSKACSAGHTSIVHLLLKRDDVDPNHVDLDGLSPLQTAVMWNHCKVAQLLLDSGRVTAPDYGLDDKHAFLLKVAASCPKDMLTLFLLHATTVSGQDAKVLLDKAVELGEELLVREIMTLSGMDFTSVHHIGYQLLAATRRNRQAIDRSRMPSPPAFSDYQMQLMLLEAQNKRRLLMARSDEREHLSAPPTEPSTSQ